MSIKTVMLLPSQSAFASLFDLMVDLQKNQSQYPDFNATINIASRINTLYIHSHIIEQALTYSSIETDRRERRAIANSFYADNGAKQLVMTAITYGLIKEIYGDEFPAAIGGLSAGEFQALLYSQMVNSRNSKVSINIEDILKLNHMRGKTMQNYATKNAAVVRGFIIPDSQIPDGISLGIVSNETTGSYFGKLDNLKIFANNVLSKIIGEQTPVYRVLDGAVNNNSMGILFHNKSLQPASQAYKAVLDETMPNFLESLDEIYETNTRFITGFKGGKQDLVLYGFFGQANCFELVKKLNREHSDSAIIQLTDVVNSNPLNNPTMCTIQTVNDVERAREYIKR